MMLALALAASAAAGMVKLGTGCAAGDPPAGIWMTFQRRVAHL